MVRSVTAYKMKLMQSFQHRLQAADFIAAFFIFLTSSASAQIPNGNFENWLKVDSVPLIKNWQISVNANWLNQGNNSNRSIRLMSDSSTKMWTAFANGSVQVNQFSGGNAYSEKPRFFQFYTRYNSDSANGALVIAVFKLKGQMIGYSEIKIAGSSNGQWELKTAPVSWFNDSRPDQVFIQATSVDIKKDPVLVEGNGTIDIDDIGFKLKTGAISSVENGNFEDTQFSYKYGLNNWFNSDKKYLDGNYSFTIRKSEEAKFGLAALKIQNVYVDTTTIYGFISTGTSLADTNRPVFAVDQKYTYLNGYYKYFPKGGDNPYINLILFYKGKECGRAELRELTEYEYIPNENPWLFFSVPIKYQGNDIPDSASIIIACSDPQNANKYNGNTSLIIDEFSLSNRSLFTSAIDSKVLHLYPNPVQEVLLFESENIFENNMAIIFDTKGEQIRNIRLENSNRIDVSLLRPGTYIMSIYNNQNQIISNYKFIKQ